MFEVSMWYVSIFVAVGVFSGGKHGVGLMINGTNTGVRNAGQGAFDPRSWFPLEHLSLERIQRSPQSFGGELVEHLHPLYREFHQRHSRSFVQSCRLHRCRRYPCYCHVNMRRRWKSHLRGCNSLPCTVRVIISRLQQPLDTHVNVFPHICPRD